MLAVNDSVTTAQSACVEAYHTGLKERKVREIKQQVAHDYLDKLFHGRVPEEIKFCSIVDSQPGAMDLIRIVMRKTGPQGASYSRFIIPYDHRDLLSGPELILDCIADPTPIVARMEVFIDEDTGEVIPILRREVI